MPRQEQVGGYACFPYNHTHDSVELKELWEKSKNIESVYFATTTFSGDSKPYFEHCSNHYLLARFRDSAALSVDIQEHQQTEESFMFSIDDDFFEREVEGNMNFVSVYYLEYGESGEDVSEIANVVAKREKVARAGLGHMDMYRREPPKFTFPYSNSIVVLEVSSDKSHQSVNKYCERTRSDVNRKGYSLTNLVSLSILEKLK